MKQIKFPDHLIASSGSMLGTVASRIARVRGLRAEDGDECEKTEEHPEIEDGGEIRVIPIRGVLMRDCRGWFPWATDTEEVEEMLQEALGDNNVTGILLDVDSPGGAVNGSVELAEAVSETNKQKPVSVYVAGDCCSAAYMIAAPATRILIRKTATVASVGVYSAMMDISGMYEQMGVKTELFKSGDQKGAGYPGTSLSDSQRLVIQSEVDRLGEQFREQIAEHRGSVNLGMLDGRPVTGEEAVFTGFADWIVVSIDDAVEVAKTFGKR